MGDEIEYKEEEVSLLLVPVPLEETEELVAKLNMSGYQAAQFKGVEDVLNALGMEPADVEDVDTEMYAEFEREFSKLRKGGPGLDGDNKRIVRSLALIGLVLTDLAKTHKRAMPPLL
jgi:hypothetical protein